MYDFCEIYSYILSKQALAPLQKHASMLGFQPLQTKTAMMTTKITQYQ